MNNIELYIENELIELDNDVQFSITKQFDDLTNPTTIINDWSKTISIPFTTHNNKLFGAIYREDNAIVNNTGSEVGIIPTVDTNTEHSIRYDADTREIIYNNYCQFVQFGFVEAVDGVWQYKFTQMCPDEGEYNYEFEYTPTPEATVNKFEFSFRNGYKTEEAFSQYDLATLKQGNKYKVSFTILKSDEYTYVSNIRFSNVYDIKGIYFDPTKKLDFKLLLNGELLMNGYAKVNNANIVNGKGSYNLTLNGEVGKVFSDLIKLTFDKSKYQEPDEKEKYYIDGRKYFSTPITKEVVYDSWNEDPDLSTPITDSKVTDIIGFGRKSDYVNDDFNPKMIQNSENSIENISDLLVRRQAFKELNISPEGYVGDGLYSSQMLQYRSYEQPPFIWISRLFDILKDNALRLGYKINLDNRWFHSGNPYYNGLVSTLKPMTFNMTSETAPGTVEDCLFSNENILWAGYNFSHTYDVPQTKPITLVSSPNLINHIENGRLYLDDEIVTYRFKTTIAGRTIVYNPATFKDGVILIVEIKVKGQNGVVETYRYGVSEPGAELDFDALRTQYNLIYFCESSKWYDDVTPRNTYYDYMIPLHLLLNKNVYGDYIELEYSEVFTSSSYPFILGGGTSIEHTINTTIIPNNDNQRTITISTTLDKHTNSIFTLNDLWNNDYSLMDIILNYTKLFDIKVVSSNKNEITFIQRINFFNDGGIIDWTDKVDYSNNFTITYNKCDNKYLKFNYKDNGTLIGKDYKAKTGFNYGEIIINTNNNFTDKTESVFKNPVAPGINVVENLPTLDRILDGRLALTKTDLFSVCTFDNDHKYVNDFGSLLFYQKAEWNTPADIWYFYFWITDDTKYQAFQNLYTYIDFTELPEYCKKTKVFPMLSQFQEFFIDEEYKKYVYLLNTINKPSYVYAQHYNFNKVKNLSIYDYIWKHYLENELYNIQNKLVTCYVKISPADFNSFSFNNFVTIGNQLYLVNKIYDYNPTNTLTKVDLITVQNKNNYIYIPAADVLMVDKTKISLEENQTDVISVESISLWNYKIISGDISKYRVVNGANSLSITAITGERNSITIELYNEMNSVSISIDTLPAIILNASATEFTVVDGSHYYFDITSNVGFNIRKNTGESINNIIPQSKTAYEISDTPETYNIDYYAIGISKGTHIYTITPNISGQQIVDRDITFKITII